MRKIDDDFEVRLIEALQPFRGFALAQGIYHMFASGLYESMTAGPAKIAGLADELGFDLDRTTGFLRFLANEGITAMSGESVSLTVKGEQLAPFRPWYELLVGGYAGTFLQISAALTGSGYADRDSRLVGVGSCGISTYDVFPLVHELFAAMPTDPRYIVDLGCGDGTFLSSLLERYPLASGLGVDKSGPAESSGSISFLRGSSTEYARSLPAAEDDDRAGRVFLAAFVLQEILEQEGRPAVVELVRTVLAYGSHLAVVEVDYRPADPAVNRHGLGLSYYNPYFLLHVITEQRLETERFWLELFAEADAAVVTRCDVDPRVDSTGLEFGYLLAPCEK